jgi:hypothetical protein
MATLAKIVSRMNAPLEHEPHPNMEAIVTRDIALYKLATVEPA